MSNTICTVDATGGSLIHHYNSYTVSLRHVDIRNVVPAGSDTHLDVMHALNTADNQGEMTDVIDSAPIRYLKMLCFFKGVVFVP